MRTRSTPGPLPVYIYHLSSSFEYTWDPSRGACAVKSSKRSNFVAQKGPNRRFWRPERVQKPPVLTPPGASMPGTLTQVNACTDVDIPHPGPLFPHPFVRVTGWPSVRARSVSSKTSNFGQISVQTRKRRAGRADFHNNCSASPEYYPPIAPRLGSARPLRTYINFFKNGPNLSV